MFIIRSQGFFYTDEYYAPSEVFKQVVKTTYETKAAANKACAALIREWVRSEPISDYVFDDEAALEAISEYFQEQWPGRDDLTIPEDATDAQIDELAKRMNVTFAQVFEVDVDDLDAGGDGDDGGSDGGSDGDGDDDDVEYDDLHYGPPTVTGRE